MYQSNWMMYIMFEANTLVGRKFKQDPFETPLFETLPSLTLLLKGFSFSTALVKPFRNVHFKKRANFRAPWPIVLAEAKLNSTLNLVH